MRMNKKVIAVLALALVMVSVLGMMPTTAEAASSSEIKKQIEEMKKENKELQTQINAIQGQINANDNEILTLVNRKNAIDQEAQLITQQIANINRQISAFNLLIADQQTQLDEAEAHLKELTEKNKDRIRAMEEEGDISYWSVLFQANSFSDLLDRISMMEEIEAADRRRMKQLSEAAREVTVAQAQLKTEKQAQEETRQELKTAEAELEAKRAEADAVLVELVAKDAEFQALMEESEKLQDELMAEIAQKEKEYKEAQHKEWLATYVPPTTWPSDDVSPSPQAPTSKGWVSPLPYYTLTSPFGNRVHPILGYQRPHNGVDLSAAKGTPIYAVKSGRVVGASFQANGAGNYVTINHGDGFTSVYMHMTHYIVSVGQQVNAGQVIGYVGSTGLSTGPHLHLGISYNGTYVNPMAYIP